MVKLDHDELLEYLAHNNIDVIAVAISHWHALGIDAFLYDLSNKYERKVQALVLILPHEQDGYIISEKDFLDDDYADIKFHYLDKRPENQNFITERIPNFISNYMNMFAGIRNIRSRTGLNNLYLLSPHLPYIELLMYFKNTLISTKYKPAFVLVDEGYASYISKENWDILTTEYLSEADYSFVDKMSNKVFRSVDNVLRDMVTRSMPVEKRFLFRLESGLKINDDICSSYKEVLKLRKNDLNMKHFDRSVLIISQPFSELNRISQKEELQFMDSLIKFINKKGLKPILKPHPREKVEKYNKLIDCDFDVIGNNFPVEEIIPNLNPKCVIGYSSTALLNSKVFYGINAVSLSDIMHSISEDEIDDEEQEFKHLTGNYINFVENIEDIEEFIT